MTVWGEEGSTSVMSGRDDLHRLCCVRFCGWHKESRHVLQRDSVTRLWAFQIVSGFNWRLTTSGPILAVTGSLTVGVARTSGRFRKSSGTQESRRAMIASKLGRSLHDNRCRRRHSNPFFKPDTNVNPFSSRPSNASNSSSRNPPCQSNEHA
jgi:hypothetical protein